MNSWRWNELEDEALASLPHAAQIIYLRVIRKHMDYGTGITGKKRLISYQQIQEVLEYRPPAGSRDKVVSYSKDQIKRLIQKIADVGLVERLHDTSSGVSPMVFMLLLADSDASQHRHESATGGAPQENARGYADDEGNTATGEPREERHPSGVRSLYQQEQQRACEDEFPMHWDWEPSEEFTTALSMRNPGLIQYLDDDLLTEFKTYWMGRRAAFRQNEWEGKLTNNLGHRKTKMAAMPSKAISDGERGIPPCPHEAILAAWNDELGALKGTSPSLVDWLGSKPSVCLEERWRESFNAKNPSGNIRYTDTTTGIEWFRVVFRTLGGMSNFRQSDVDVFKLFYKETFVRATKGSLRQQSGGAVR